jgi:hypothetical protein
MLVQWLCDEKIIEKSARIGLNGKAARALYYQFEKSMLNSPLGASKYTENDCQRMFASTPDKCFCDTNH